MLKLSLMGLKAFITTMLKEVRVNQLKTNGMTENISREIDNIKIK